MATYIEPPIEVDGDALADEALDYLASVVPGWVPADGHLEVWLVQAVARMVADAQVTASTVPVSIFRYFGSTLVGVQPIDAANATTTTTWTMQDAAGYTIPAGTQVAFRTAGDTLLPFVVTEDVVVPPGSAATAAGAVPVRAVDVGAAANGLTGPMELLDPLVFVTSVLAVAPTTGGVDAEADDVYLARLGDELRLLTPRPIYAQDFATLARKVAGVHRATAVDNYNPVDDTIDNERMVAVAAVDVEGTAVSPAVQADVQAYLEALREVNFVVNVFDPVTTPVDVNFSFTINPGADPAVVQGNAVAAVRLYLDPATWGADPGDKSKVSWTNQTTVRYNDLISVLYAVDGLRSVPDLTIEGVAGDFALPGKVALPQAGTVSGVLA